VSLLVDGLPNLQDVLRPRLFAVVELVQARQVRLQQPGVRFDLEHHTAHALVLLVVFRVARVLEVLHEVLIQVFQRHQLSMRPPGNAQRSTSEQKANEQSDEMKCRK
jgi:hypothetical protein